MNNMSTFLFFFLFFGLAPPKKSPKTSKDDSTPQHQRACVGELSSAAWKKRGKEVSMVVERCIFSPKKLGHVAVSGAGVLGTDCKICKNIQ